SEFRLTFEDDARLRGLLHKREIADKLQRVAETLFRVDQQLPSRKRLPLPLRGIKMPRRLIESFQPLFVSRPASRPVPGKQPCRPVVERGQREAPTKFDGAAKGFARFIEAMHRAES